MQSIISTTPSVFAIVEADRRKLGGVLRFTFPFLDSDEQTPTINA